MRGEELERFVARLEQSLLPPGFQVETRVRAFSADGVQIAEFDVLVTGTIDSTSTRFCIECRDRPSEGAAPASWIEQLVGRRQRFCFDRIIAVSTTGFATPAVEFAREAHIELRTVTTLTPDSLLDWLGTEHLEMRHRHVHLAYFKVLVADTEPAERVAAASQVVKSSRPDDAILLNPVTDQLVRPVDAFEVAISRRPALWPPELEDGEWSDDVEIRARYPTNDCYQLRTELGLVSVPELLFRGTLTLRVAAVPLNQRRTYVNEITGRPIASSASGDYTVGTRIHTVAIDHVETDGTSHLYIRFDDPC